MNSTLVLVVFGFVYLGMVLGRIPGLALDRTGVALLGAIVLIVGEQLDAQAAWNAVDVPTMGLLFGLMVVSAQFSLSGFYGWFTRRLSEVNVSPRMFLALVIAGAGGLSAVLTNDIVCLAMAPILAEGCCRRRLNPVPFLLALACAANVGSAATLIGNPQNMLIGQVLHLSFPRFLAEAGVPAVGGLVLVWWVLRSRIEEGDDQLTLSPIPPPTLNRWQTVKGITILLALMAAFLFTSWPRDVLALGAAGLILTSRRTASHRLLELVDWHLLVLFGGLFIVNAALADSGLLAETMQRLRDAGADPSQPAWLFVVTVVLSNLVSNVPATMLLLPVATHPLAGPILALSSTLAGNLFIVGSIANIIVVDQAARLGVTIGWKDHARVGIPITLATLALSALWLAGLTWWGR